MKAAKFTTDNLNMTKLTAELDNTFLTEQEAQEQYAPVNSSNTVSTASTANQLTNSQSLQVNLASTTPASFNGTASASIGVSGVLPVTNGGTGQTSFALVRSALGLGNTTGVLGVAYGGTGQSSLANVSVGYATSATYDGAGRNISGTYVTNTVLSSAVSSKIGANADGSVLLNGNYLSLHPESGNKIIAGLYQIGCTNGGSSGDGLLQLDWGSNASGSYLWVKGVTQIRVGDKFVAFQS